MLVLLTLDEVDAVVDQVDVEVLDLLFRQLDLFEAGDDLVVGQKPFLLTVLYELVQLLDVGEGDVYGEHRPRLSSRMVDWGYLPAREEPVPPICDSGSALAAGMLARNPQFVNTSAPTC